MVAWSSPSKTLPRICEFCSSTDFPLTSHFFRALLLRAPPPQMQSSSVYDLLKQVLGRKSISLYTFKNYCGLLLLQLKRPISKVDINVLQTLTHIIKNAKETLSHAEFASLQQYLFSERMELRHLSCQDLSSECLPGPSDSYHGVYVLEAEIVSSPNDFLE